jgi:hypothetical protein
VRRTSAIVILTLTVTLNGCSDGTKPAVDEPVKAPTKVTADVPRLFDSPDGRFRVRFAGEPSVRKNTEGLKPGIASEEAFSLIRLPYTYIVECTHLSEPRDAAKEIQRLIGESQAPSPDLKVLESKDVTLKGRPGKDTTCTVEEDRLVRERFFVDGKDSYHLISMAPNSDEGKKAASAFVESFEFLKD